MVRVWGLGCCSLKCRHKGLKNKSQKNSVAIAAYPNHTTAPWVVAQSHCNDPVDYRCELRPKHRVAHKSPCDVVRPRHNLSSIGSIVRLANLVDNPLGHKVLDDVASVEDIGRLGVLVWIRRRLNVYFLMPYIMKNDIIYGEKLFLFHLRPTL